MNLNIIENLILKKIVFVWNEPVCRRRRKFDHAHDVDFLNLGKLDKS